MTFQLMVYSVFAVVVITVALIVAISAVELLFLEFAQASKKKMIASVMPTLMPPILTIVRLDRHVNGIITAIFKITKDRAMIINLEWKVFGVLQVGRVAEQR